MPGREDYARKSFEAALLFAFANRSASVVHGWIRSNPSDSPDYIPYAWNELEGDVYDLTQHDRPMSKELFYRKHDVSQNRLRTYSVQEAACMAVGTCRYGPWDRVLFDVEKLSHGELIARFGED